MRAPAPCRNAPRCRLVAALFEDAALEHMRGGKVSVQIERLIDVILGGIDAAFLEGDGGSRIMGRGAAAAAGQHAVDLGARRLVGALVGQDERTHQRNIGCIGLHIAGHIEVAQGALGVAVGAPHDGAAVRAAARPRRRA